MSSDVDDHELISSEKVFDGRIIKVFIDDVRLPDGRIVKWEKVKHPGAVGIVPVLEDGSIVMVRQYRNATDEVILEIPAGKLSPGEPPEECARRELREETGFSAGEMIKLAEFYNSPGYSDEYFHVYIARDLTYEGTDLEPDEFLEEEKVGLSEAIGKIPTGEIRDAKTIIGLTLARLYLERAIPDFKKSD
ncbi:MAG: NUDIX hydrolase [Actinobacteria bacterium]|nr:NUDIX hydrolase [Actinomycetota bacterium]